MPAPSTRHIQPLLPGATTVVPGRITVMLASRGYRRGHWLLQPPGLITVVTSAPFAPVAVTCVAVPTRLVMKRHMPLQGYDATVVTGLGVNTLSTGTLIGRFLGPQPPQVILPLPTQLMQTVGVVFNSIADRVARKRRRSIWFETPQLLANPPPAGPVVTQIQVTLAGRTRTDDLRRGTHPRVLRPAVYNIPFFSTSVWLASRGYRRGHWDFNPPAYTSNVTMPQFVPVPPPAPVVTTLQVTYFGRAPRETYWRRRVESIYFGPAIVNPSPPIVSTLTVWNQPRPRIELPSRRAAHYRLAPPAVTEPSLLGSDRRLLLDIELQAIPTRVSLVRRGPHSRLAPPAVTEPRLLGSDRRLVIDTELQAIATRVTLQRRGTHSYFTPLPPVSTPAAPVVTTILVKTVRTRPRHTVGLLAPPATLEPWSVAIQERTIHIWTSGRTRTELQRRASHYKLFPGIAEPMLQMPDRRLYVQVDTQALWTRVAAQRRAPHYFVVPPQTLQVFGGPAVALADQKRLARRPGHALVQPPATLEPEAVQIAERTIRVVLAGRTRIEAPRRAPHYFVHKGVVEPALQMPDRRLYVQVDSQAPWTRLAWQRRSVRYFRPAGIVEPSLLGSDRRLLLDVELQAIATRSSFPRRAPHYFIKGPAIGVTQPPAPVATTILVVTVSVRTRVENQRHAPHSHLYTPAVVEPSLLGSDRRLLLDIELQSVATRVALPRHAPRYFLYPPATLEPASVAQRERTIDTELVAVPDRQIRVRRGPHSFLSPPATLESAETQLVERTIHVWLGGRTRVELQRRAPHYALKPGIAEPPLQVPDRRLRIPATLAPAPRQPRKTHAFYRGPVTFPQSGTIAVWLSGRTRVEVQRRAPHYRLGAPTTLQVFGGPSVTLGGRKRIEAQRRAPHYQLNAPTVLQTFAGPRVTLAAVSTRVALTRHAPHSHLAAPTVTLQITRDQQTLRVTCAAIKNRVTYKRRVVQSTVHPPTKILPPIPPVKIAIDVVDTMAQFTRASMVRRGPHSRLYPPAVFTPYNIVTWRLFPDTNWILTGAAGNEWRTTADINWVLSAAAGNEWRETAEPISGWTMKGELP